MLPLAKPPHAPVAYKTVDQVGRRSPSRQIRGEMLLVRLMHAPHGNPRLVQMYPYMSCTDRP